MTLIMPATTSGRFVGRFMGRTFLVGLENNIPNSFLNGIVFLFWCISGLKERIMSHICDDPLCVACELRFLFRMFDQGLATQKEVSTGASSHHHFTSHHHIITSHDSPTTGHRRPRHQLLPRARTPHRHHRLRHSGRPRRDSLSVPHTPSPHSQTRRALHSLRAEPDGGRGAVRATCRGRVHAANQHVLSRSHQHQNQHHASSQLILVRAFHSHNSSGRPHNSPSLQSWSNPSPRPRPPRCGASRAERRSRVVCRSRCSPFPRISS